MEWQALYILFVMLNVAIKVEVSDTTMFNIAEIAGSKKSFLKAPASNFFPQLTKISELSLIM